MQVLFAEGAVFRVPHSGNGGIDILPKDWTAFEIAVRDLIICPPIR
jgi:hypothetical protein